MPALQNKPFSGKPCEKVNLAKYHHRVRGQICIMSPTYSEETYIIKCLFIELGISHFFHQIFVENLFTRH